ncbi:MAG: hypothetical protein HOE90_18155 [Bacteriovoracaceae bacterium]|nr:hypothetical protein [Bacteriovoracaceae bacterium]
MRQLINPDNIKIMGGAAVLGLLTGGVGAYVYGGYGLFASYSIGSGIGFAFMMSTGAAVATYEATTQLPDTPSLVAPSFVLSPYPQDDTRGNGIDWDSEVFLLE